MRVFVGGVLPGGQRRGDEGDDPEAVQPVRREAAGRAAEAQRREGGSLGVYVAAAEEVPENIRPLLWGRLRQQGFCLEGRQQTLTGVGVKVLIH